MLSKLLRNTEWKQLRAFASPALFDVIPVRELYARARAVRLSRGDEHFAEAVASRARSLREVPLAIELPEQGKPVADELGEGRTADATRIVTLYFHQLFSSGPTLIDLRCEAFHSEVAELRWSPAPWVCTWSDDFLHPLRDVYRGFYEEDDERFTQGLRALHIEHAADLFREHFGEEQGDQAFVMSHFVRTFHQVFVRCRDAGVRLHPDFLPLGVYLAGLYDCLDGEPVRVDVRACFERAVRTRSDGSPEAHRQEHSTHG